MKTVTFAPRLLKDLRRYSKEKFMADLMAGLIVGIVALPLAIAFGIASGVSPEKGIITAIVAGFIISALGGSRVILFLHIQGKLKMEIQLKYCPHYILQRCPF